MVVLNGAFDSDNSQLPIHGFANIQGNAGHQVTAYLTSASMGTICRYSCLAKSKTISFWTGQTAKTQYTRFLHYFKVLTMSHYRENVLRT